MSIRITASARGYLARLSCHAKLAAAGPRATAGAAVVDFSERHWRILFEWINGDADELISPSLTEASTAKSLPAGERKPPLRARGALAEELKKIE